MRRNATKVAAVVMSLAVTMTSVNLPTTAAAATKKVKLNKTKATLTVGKTTTLKVTKGGKAVKATFKSNKPKIAKVVKKSGKSTKIKALKKGTATITATYAKKKYKCKITVKAKKVVKPTTAPTVAPTVEPTVVPTTEPSTDAALSTKENAANVKLELTNAYNDKYLDTVLVGTNAFVKATVTDKDGKPVADVPVVLNDRDILGVSEDKFKVEEVVYNTETKKNETKTRYKDHAYIGVRGDSVVKTNKDGEAVFVYGFSKTKDEDGIIDAMRSEYVSSYKLTATVAGSNVKNEAVVRFGAVTVEKTNADSSAIIGVDNNIKSDDSIPDIVPGKNASGKGIFTTTDANGKTAEYVYSQQVSKSGSKDHAVKLSTAAYLIVPDKEDELQSNTIVETYNKGINEYGVYADKSERYVVKSTKASNLQYATVNFKDLKLSKYSKLTVEAYLCDSNADDAKLEDGQRIWVEKYNQDKVVGSDKEDITLDKWSVQIPLEDVNGEKYLHVVAKINSAGQVNDDVNDGFTVTTIEGVYKKGTANSSGVKEILDDVSISWDIDKNVTYTDLTALTDDTIKTTLNKEKSGELKANSTDDYKTYGDLEYTYKYKVPAFPRTGNAIIYVYNKKNDVVAYYACTTKNDGENRNELAYAPGNLYQLSEDEAKNQTGDITEQNATSVTVNAEKTGITNIVGTITSNNKNVEIDASNNKVYSSIHWNPIPVEAAKDTRTPAIALAGQQMKIVAQLADVNGNPVTVKDKAIKFKVGDTEVDAALGTATKVTKVSKDVKTNAKGQAELILSAEDAAELIGVSAESESKEYTVVYRLGGKDINTKVVDLYWLDFDLSFTNTAIGTSVTTSTRTADSMVVSGSAIGTATVGSNWKYGVKIDGSRFNPGSKGILADHKNLTFAGITSIISNRLNSKGSYTKGENMVNITSKEAGLSEIIFKLNKNSFAEALTFTFKKSDDKDPIEGFYAGIGDPSINKTLNLNIQWDAYGVNGSFVLPTGRYATKDSALNTYYKLVDKFGNPLKDEKVTFNAFKNGKDLGLKTEMTTDENGVAKFPVASAYLENGASYVVTATYDGVTTSQSYKVMAKSEESFKVKEAGYDAKTKKLTLRFSEDVVSSSVLADMFSKKNGNAIIFSDGVNEHSYNVAAVEVSGTDVAFTLPDTFTESVSNDSYFKINFKTVPIDGIDYAVASDMTGETINGHTATVTLEGVIFE